MSNQGLQSVLMSYSQVSKVKVLTPGTGLQFEVFEIEAHNRSGGAIDVGVGYRFPDSLGSWSFGKIIVADTPDFTDQTSTIQDGSTVTLYTTTTNDGFLIQSPRRFNLIGFSVTQAESGSPVYTYQYYNGTAYATLTTIKVSASYTVADHVIAFAAPQDWAVGTTAAVGGSTSLYSILMKASTAPGTAVQANAMWVSAFLNFTEGVADNGKVVCTAAAGENFTLQSTEGVVPFFGTANAANTVRVTYKSR